MILIDITLMDATSSAKLRLDGHVKGLDRAPVQRSAAMGLLLAVKTVMTDWTMVLDVKRTASKE